MPATTTTVFSPLVFLLSLLEHSFTLLGLVYEPIADRWHASAHVLEVGIARMRFSPSSSLAASETPRATQSTSREQKGICTADTPTNEGEKGRLNVRHAMVTREWSDTAPSGDTQRQRRRGRARLTQPHPSALRAPLTVLDSLIYRCAVGAHRRRPEIENSGMEALLV